MKKIIAHLFVLGLLVSCASKEEFVYMQNAGAISGENNSNVFETKFQPDDLLLINISSKDPEAAIPFNLGLVSNASVNSPTAGQAQQQFYLVDNDGFVEFPILGKLKVGGETRTTIISLLKEKLKPYLQDPIINIRIMNYKISVLGEVNRPGSYSITSERISVLEALSLAGDLTIYGERKNVVVVREVNGKKQSTKIDLTKTDFIKSDFYYLKQNDVIYVEPNKTKVNSSAVGPNTSVIISAISILITVTGLIIQTTR